ncbi:DUF4912 domain-containing protein [Candidatus Omnitrophota bacterium]
MPRILRRKKDKLKVVEKGKPRKQKPVIARRQAAAKQIPIELAVGTAKFYSPPPPSRPEGQRAPLPAPVDLPAGYAQDRIVLQVRDPWWIHAYWEITESAWERVRHDFPSEFARGFRRVLRVYDVSNIIFNGDNAHRFFDIEITQEAKNWYIDTQGPGRSWCVDFGIQFSDGRFITIVRSNAVSTPLAGPSWITDEEWMIPEDMFTRLYGMGVGMGSSPVGLKRLWEERLRNEVGSGALSSLSSPVKIKQERQQGFWLKVNTELIVYGQTEADAKVTVGGRAVTLRPDGSFCLRFFLPDGKQVIPVVATSSDGEQIRKIIPIVTKETK